MGILMLTLGILGGGPLTALGEEEELGTMVLLLVEEGAVEAGGVARADMGGVGAELVGVDPAEVEILLLLLFGLLFPPLDLGKGVVGSETGWGGPPMPLDIIMGPMGPIWPMCPMGMFMLPGRMPGLIPWRKGMCWGGCPLGPPGGIIWGWGAAWWGYICGC